MDTVGDSMGMEHGPASVLEPVPWPTDRLWAEAQAVLGHSLVRNAVRLAPARRHAEAVAHSLDRLVDLFDQLAPATCAVCPDPCCGHAKVWLDFKDLLFLHLNRKSLPPHQLRCNLHEPCRYLGPMGCRLPRRSRPWICTWYICPLQRRVLEREIPGGVVQADALRRRVKALRHAMESAFLEAVGRGAVAI